MSNATYLAMIVASGLLTYAIRLSGFLVKDREIPSIARRFMHFVPIAAFAALIAPGLAGTDADLVPRLLAAAAASVAVVRFGRLWLCIAVGMTVFWLTRWLI